MLNSLDTNQIVQIIITLIAIIAIKITFSFDINKYLDSRKETHKIRLQTNCTHVNIQEIGQDIGFRSTFFSPVGNTAYICQKCGFYTYAISEESELERVGYYINNPKEFSKQEKYFSKLLKKGGYL